MDVKLGCWRKGHKGRTGVLVSIVPYSRPSLVIIALVGAFSVIRDIRITFVSSSSVQVPGRRVALPLPPRLHADGAAAGVVPRGTVDLRGRTPALRQ